MQVTQIDALCAALTTEAVFDKVSNWRNQRIYINGFGRDIKAFITFDDPMAEDYPHLMHGAALKVYSDADQSGAWLMNRRKQVKHEIMLGLKSSGVLPPDFTVCATWQEAGL